MNRERGVFTYDPKTNTYGEAPEDVVVPPHSKRKEDRILDFGDVFMISEFLKSTGLTSVIEAIECQHPNTLWALIYFYTLTKYNISCCQSWYEGSYTSILYPNANLTIQNINSLLEEIGTENSYQKFFDYYLKWFKENKDNPETIQNAAVTGKEDTDKEKDKDANEEKDKSEGGNKHESIKPTIQFLFAIQKESSTPVYLEILPILKADDTNQTSETNRIKEKETAVNAAEKELETYGIPADSCSFYFHQQFYPADRAERAESFCIPDRINNTSTASLLYENPDLQNQDQNQYQDRIRGSLLLSFIADVIHTLLTKKLRKLEKQNQADISFEEACVLARNLKCKVFENYTVPNKPQPKLSEIFETLGVKVPAKIMLGTRKSDAGPDKNSKEQAQLQEGQ